MYQETDDYRYQNEFVNWTVASLEDSEVVDALKRIGVEKNEGDVQTVVSEVITTSAIQIDQLPCLEFHLYNAEEDVLYARVWNTRLGQWDKVLESALNDKERKEWREVYL